MNTKKITVTRSFTYDVEDIRQSWLDALGETLLDHEVIEIIMDSSWTDHNSPVSWSDLIMVDSDTGETIRP
jgi:hypothetical protein